MELLVIALLAAATAFAATWVIMRGARRKAVAAAKIQLAVLREQTAALGSAAEPLERVPRKLQAVELLALAPAPAAGGATAGAAGSAG